MVENGAPIGVFGLGTKVTVSADCAVGGHGVQAGGVRRKAGDEIEPRQGVPAGGQAGCSGLETLQGSFMET